MKAGGIGLLGAMTARAWSKEDRTLTLYVGTYTSGKSEGIYGYHMDQDGRSDSFYIHHVSQSIVPHDRSQQALSLCGE
jgi:hypothetical protein